MEIKLSLESKKNMIPLAWEGFVFPPSGDLPDDVSPMLQHNAVIWSHMYSDAAVDKLVSRLVKE